MSSGLNKLEVAINDKLHQVDEYGSVFMRPGVVLKEQEVEYLKSQYGLKTEAIDIKTKEPFKVHNMCINCQARHILKYKDHSQAGKNPFQVKCNFVNATAPKGTKKLLDELLLDTELDENLVVKIVFASFDPAKWAELMFNFDANHKPTEESLGWALRWYQEEQIRCTAKRQAYLQGRRTAKTFTSCVKLLDHAYNLKVVIGYTTKGEKIERGPKIAIATPFQPQLTTIFEELERLIRMNPDLENEVIKTKNNNFFSRNPEYSMSFKNGAKISGYVAGSNNKVDGSGGGSMRGISPDVIYIDEVDMIPRDVIQKVIRPLLITNPNVRLYMSSTPIGQGKKGEFYRTVEDDPQYKSYYLPSTVLPHWDMFKEEIRRTHTEEAFEAEYLARFIESGLGVFKMEYIMRSKRNYDYKDTKLTNKRWWSEYIGIESTNNLIKVIGIDWNKTAGTEMVVLAYDTENHLWICVDAINIPASEFTSVKYKEAVVELNHKWQPHYIYADEGYGHHIIDDLRWEAHRLAGKDVRTPIEESTVRLTDVLRSINFSSTVSYRDPITGEEKDQLAKHLMVENAVNVFEEGRIWYPETDQVLSKQLQVYTILSIGKNGKPVYGPGDKQVGDHRVDALMLALLALFLEEHPLYSGKSLGIGSSYSVTKNELQGQSGMTVKDLAFSVKAAGMGGMFDTWNITRTSLTADEQGSSGQKQNQTRPRSAEFEDKYAKEFPLVGKKYAGESGNTFFENLPSKDPSEPKVGTRKKRSHGSRSRLFD